MCPNFTFSFFKPSTVNEVWLTASKSCGPLEISESKVSGSKLTEESESTTNVILLMLSKILKSGTVLRFYDSTPPTHEVESGSFLVAQSNVVGCKCLILACMFVMDHH